MNHPSKQNEQAEAEAQAQSEAARALPALRGLVGSSGAPPSNTAPDNSIGESSKVLRGGVDSLYLSFTGDLRESFEKRLEDRKLQAQSDDARDHPKAVLKLFDNEFRVLPHGAQKYPFILDDGMFNIQLSRFASERMPLAYVRIASRVLTECGLQPTFDHLDSIVRLLGVVKGVKVSRVDVCCDFVTDYRLGEVPESAWISRSRKRNRYTEGGDFTGCVFGAGSSISARLYNKTLQILKSRQDYLRDFWWIEGWGGEATVWRMEFQIRREVLVEFGIDTFEDLKAKLQALWGYATGHWLRLVVPGKDNTRTRWPNHPLWDVLSAADLGADDGCLIKRNLSQCVPDDRYLFTAGLAPLTSYMAARGIPSYHEAWPRFVREAEEFHAFRSIVTGEDMGEYCRKKAALKGRKYNKALLPVDGEGE